MFSFMVDQIDLKLLNQSQKTTKELRLVKLTQLITKQDSFLLLIQMRVPLLNLNSNTKSRQHYLMDLKLFTQLKVTNNQVNQLFFQKNGGKNGGNHKIFKIDWSILVQLLEVYFFYVWRIASAADNLNPKKCLLKIWKRSRFNQVNWI